METLRFLMVTSFYPPYHLGGDAVHVEYLAEALAARGHEVHVEFSPAAYRLKRRDAPPLSEEDHGIYRHPIPSPFGRAQPAAAYVLGRSRAVSRHHAGLLRAIRPDVVHLHNISLLGSNLLRLRGPALTVYTAHDFWVRCPRSDLLKGGKHPCETPTCVSCSLASRRPPQLWRYGTGWRGPQGVGFAIAPSRFMAAAIRPHVSCPVLCLPNFAPDPNPGGTVLNPADYYLFVGALEPHKGVPELAAAAERLPHMRIRFAGRGSLAGRLLELRGRGSRNIEVDGWLSHAELRPLYRRARALILPSTGFENAPLAAIEALAWGTPLLVSRRGGLGELLHDGTAGRSFEPTCESLVDALVRFDVEHLPRRLRISARAAYAQHHRPETYLDRYLAAVRDPPRASEPPADASGEVPSLPPASLEALPGAGVP